MFEKKLVLRIFEGKRDEVTGEWRIFHNSPDMITNIRSKMMRLVDDVACKQIRNCLQHFDWEA